MEDGVRMLLLEIVKKIRSASLSAGELSISFLDRHTKYTELSFRLKLFILKEKQRNVVHG